MQFALHFVFECFYCLVEAESNIPMFFKKLIYTIKKKIFFVKCVSFCNRTNIKLQNDYLFLDENLDSENNEEVEIEPDVDEDEMYKEESKEDNDENYATYAEDETGEDDNADLYENLEEPKRNKEAAELENLNDVKNDLDLESSFTSFSVTLSVILLLFFIVMLTLGGGCSRLKHMLVSSCRKSGRSHVAWSHSGYKPLSQWDTKSA